MNNIMKHKTKPDLYICLILIIFFLLAVYKDNVEKQEGAIAISGVNIAEAEDLEEIVLNKININNATIDELKVITLMTEKKAGRIIKYRDEAGGFKSIDELLNVPGITMANYEYLKEEAFVK